MPQELHPPQQQVDLLRALRAGFCDFYEHGLEQLTSMDEKNGMLRFATVSLQISLELYVKQELLACGELGVLFEDAKKGKPAKFRPFSKILKAFIKLTAKHCDRLKSANALVGTLHARNAIVHSGKISAWNPKLARQVITTALFIETSQARETNKLIPTKNQYVRQKLSCNSIWRERTQEMAAGLASDNATEVLFCPFCSNRSLLPSDVFRTAEPDELNFSCATCFETLIRDHHGDVVRCPLCHHQALWIDTNNPQEDGRHAGICLRCEQKAEVYECSGCGQRALRLALGTSLCEDCSDTGKANTHSVDR